MTGSELFSSSTGICARKSLGRSFNADNTASNCSAVKPDEMQLGLTVQRRLGFHRPGLRHQEYRPQGNIPGDRDLLPEFERSEFSRSRRNQDDGDDRRGLQAHDADFEGKPTCDD